MKKLYYVQTLAAVLIGTTSALAWASNDDTAVSVSGHFRVRGESSHQTNFAGTRDFMLMRVRPQIKFTRSDDLDVIFTPQFSRAFGERLYIPSSATANTLATISGSIVDPMLGVHEAYGVYRASDALEFSAGRMVYSYGDELVVGALDWQNVARTFDGLKIRTKCGIGWTDLFANKIVDNSISVAGPGSVDFYGLYNSFELSDYIKNLDVYTFYKKDASGASVSHLAASGVRLASKWDSIDYRFEVTKEFGNGLVDATTAHQFDIEGGYTFGSYSSPRLGLEYFNAGLGYDQLYPTIHKWLGFADVLSRRNISGIVVHLENKWTDKFKSKIDFHTFMRTDTSAPAFMFSGAALGAANASSSKMVGYEVDLTLSYQLTKDLGLTGGGSLFLPGDYIKAQFSQKPAFYYLQTVVKF